MKIRALTGKISARREKRIGGLKVDHFGDWLSPFATAMVGPRPEFSPGPVNQSDPKMHYYQFNIGDYARDTGHLSILEHGIYRLLLDWCYLNEKPITTEQAIRVGRGNPTETQSVLSEFFKQEDAGWTHRRVTAEIASYHKKTAANRMNGVKGGRPTTKNNPVGFVSVSAGFPDVTQLDANHNPNQEPITNNQEPRTKEEHPQTPKGADRVEGLFTKFWQEYPKKVGKDAALSAFKKRKPTQELLDDMLKALGNQKSSEQWLKNGGQFIPNPATWINQGRWQDGENTPAGLDAVKALFPGAI